jgi:hypothetical protein
MDNARMMFSRCALLCLLVACGSPRAKPVEPLTGSQGSGSASQPQPVAKPVALAIVLEGWEMWVGNDQLPNIPEDERYMGALPGFQQELGRLSLAGFPAGSMAAVVTYTETATVRRPMQPIEKLAPADFGDQKDYYGTIDRNLVAGVTAGLDELAKVPNARRVLLVIGDGSDSNNAAKTALAGLGKRAAAENVEIVSFRYLGVFSSPGSMMRALDPNEVTINSLTSIVDQMDWLFTRLKKPPADASKPLKAPLAVALLVMGSELWIGNDDSTPVGDPTRYTGALKPIRAALEKAPLKSLPTGSVGMIASYDTGTKVRFPMGPIESLEPRSAGVQRDYYGRIGSDLVSGLTQTFKELVEIDAPRRVLIVIGDGADTNNEAAKPALQELAKRAAEYHIEVHAIVYKSDLSPEETIITALDPKADTVKKADDITAKLVALFSSLQRK